MDQPSKSIWADILHDLNAPIISIEGLTQLLLENDCITANEECLQMVQRVSANTEYLTHFIKRLSLWLRIQSTPKSDISHDSISLEEFTKDFIYRNKRDLAMEQVKIEHGFPKEDLHVQIDRHWLENIMILALENAIQNNREQNGQIWITCESNEKNVSLFIDNTGVTLPDFVLKNAFTLLFYWRPTDERIFDPERRPGFGLCLINEMMKKVDGQAQLENLSKYRQVTGTRLRLRFPKAS